jgi:hypothetical protein
MAYVSQDLKAKLAPTIKAICKKYGVKASIAVRNHSTLCLNIKSGKIDFIENFIERDAGVMSGRKMAPEQVDYLRKNRSLDVNVYWYKEHFTGKALKFLQEVIPAMNNGNHDNSDIQTDYFDVGWYIDVNIGRWNKPYTVEA